MIPADSKQQMRPVKLCNALTYHDATERGVCLMHTQLWVFEWQLPTEAHGPPPCHAMECN